MPIPFNLLAAASVYNFFSVTGSNLERGRGPLESFARGYLAGTTTFAFGTIAGGAVSAALSGQDPGRGALLGFVQGAAAAVGGALGVPTNPFVAVGQAAAIGAASGAAGAAIVGGNPLQGAWMGAASAATVTASFRVVSALMRSGRLQEGIDAAQKEKGQGSTGGTPDALTRAQPRESVRGRFELAHALGGSDGVLLEVQALSADMAPRIETFNWVNPLTSAQAREFWLITGRVLVEMYAHRTGVEIHDLQMREIEEILNRSRER